MTSDAIVADFYTKEGCSLCREMKAILGRVGGEYPLTIREIDIETDPSLYARFAEEVPVLYLDGRKAFKYRVSEAALRRKLMLVRWQRRLSRVATKKAEL